MLGCVFPKYTSVTSKSSLKWTPILGWFSKPNSPSFSFNPSHRELTTCTVALSKTVFINRSSSKDARAAFDSAVRTMHKDRQSVFIFPEGTRSYYSKPEMLPFKKGAFHLAVQAQVPVIPVVVANYSNILDVKRRKFDAGIIPVSILAPVETKGLGKEDVDGLTQRVRKMMEEELVNITKVAVTQGIAIPNEPAKGYTDGALESSAVER